MVGVVCFSSSLHDVSPADGGSPEVLAVDCWFVLVSTEGQVSGTPAPFLVLLGAWAGFSAVSGLSLELYVGAGV